MPRGVSVFRSLSAIAKLKKIFRKQQFDLVQYSTPNAAFYASIAAKRARVRVRNYHLMGLRYLGANGWKRKLLFALEKRACKHSTHIECVSPSNLQLALSHKLFTADKGKVVWNGSSGGIDLQRFDVNNRAAYREEIRVRHNVEEKAFVFGFVGRITKDKGVDELLSAFSNLEGATLMIVGPQEGIQTLNPTLYAQSLENENIRYIGAVQDVEKYYCAMDVLVFPSYREGFGNVVMEAAAMGTPAIISNIPGPIDAVQEGQTALLVPPRDAAALQAAMQKLVNAPLTQELSVGAADYVREQFNQDILNEHILQTKLALLKEEI